MVRVTTRRQDPRRLDQDHADARTLREAAAGLRSETNQARYTNRDLDPYPLFTLAELLDIVAREVSIGELHPRNAVRRGALDLARQLQSQLRELDGRGSAAPADPMRTQQGLVTSGFSAQVEAGTR